MIFLYLISLSPDTFLFWYILQSTLLRAGLLTSCDVFVLLLPICASWHVCACSLISYPLYLTVCLCMFLCGSSHVFKEGQIRWYSPRIWPLVNSIRILQLYLVWSIHLPSALVAQVPILITISPAPLLCLLNPLRPSSPKGYFILSVRVSATNKMLRP